MEAVRFLCFEDLNFFGSLSYIVEALDTINFFILKSQIVCKIFCYFEVCVAEEFQSTSVALFSISVQWVFNSEFVIWKALNNADPSMPLQLRFRASASLQNPTENVIAFRKVDRTDVCLPIVKLNSSLTVFARKSILCASRRGLQWHCEVAILA